MTPQTAVLDIDGLREVSGQRDETVVGDIVHPLDDFRNAATGTGDFARLAEQHDADLLLRARKTVRHANGLRIGR